MIITEILRKWFRLEPIPCPTCEILRTQLEESNRERRELLTRLLTPPEPPPIIHEKDEPKAIQPQFIPWKVRQQMLEAEDRKRAQLMRDKTKEIEDLEKELGVASDVPRGVSGGLSAKVK
jgi:hypothetical protein